MTINDTSALIGLVLGLVSFIGGAIAWYRGSVEKDYASRRDFGHLKRNYEQVADAVTQLSKEVEAIAAELDRTHDDLLTVMRLLDDVRTAQVEAKGLSNATFSRLEIVAAQLSGNISSGWRNPNLPG